VLRLVEEGWQVEDEMAQHHQIHLHPSLSDTLRTVQPECHELNQVLKATTAARSRDEHESLLARL